MQPTVLFVVTAAKYRGLRQREDGSRICCTTSKPRLLEWARRWSTVYHADTIACRPATAAEASLVPVRG